MESRPSAESFEDRDPAVPTEDAYAHFVITDREADNDDTGLAEFPSANAEITISESGLGVIVPGRYARHLLDVTTHAVTVAGIAWAPKFTAETAGLSMPGWVLILIVMAQLSGTVWLGRKAVRRRG